MAVTPNSRCLCALAAIVVLAVSFPSIGAYDVLDPYGNIAIKWDIMSWTADGYTATVSIINNQQFRGLKSYALGWWWAKKEVIWVMTGARATDQGDCSKYPANPPHSCIPDPTIIDLAPGVPYGQQSANCCRDGAIAAFAQDPKNSVSSFIITVGNSGNTNTTVIIPRKLSLKSPGPGYTCSELKKVPATRFPSPDGKRFTQAYLTWNATCTYSQYLAHKTPTCCVSLSAFYSDKIVKCPDCACSCTPNITLTAKQPFAGSGQACVPPNTNYKSLPLVASGTTDHQNPSQIIVPPKLFCTNDMCPVKIHWHLKDNYAEYWRSKVTITNRNLVANYSSWNLVVQHPNFVNFTEAFSFTHKALSPYGDVINDTAMFWGMKYYNEMLLQAGPEGNVQSEFLFAKDSHFTLSQGWGFPSRIYFNGDDCVLPDAQDYPSLPNSSVTLRIGLSAVLCLLVSVALSLSPFL